MMPPNGNAPTVNPMVLCGQFLGIGVPTLQALGARLETCLCGCAGRVVFINEMHFRQVPGGIMPELREPRRVEKAPEPAPEPEKPRIIQ